MSLGASGTIIVNQIDGNDNFDSVILDSSNLIPLIGNDVVLITGTQTVTGAKNLLNPTVSGHQLLVAPSGTDFRISLNTPTGAETKRIFILGGESGFDTAATLRLHGGDFGVGGSGDGFLEAGSLSGNMYIGAAYNHAIRFRGRSNPAGTAWNELWRINPDTNNFSQVLPSGNLIFSNPDVQILQNTLDGSDTSLISIGGGGAIDQARGAFLTLYGNEYATYSGALRLAAGETLGYISLETNGLGRWSVASGGDFLPQTHNTYAIGASGNTASFIYARRFFAGQKLVFQQPNGDIVQETSDGTDTRRIRIGGGGDVLDTRGSFIEVYGNESTQTISGGELFLHGGNVPTGHIYLATSGTNRWWLTTTGNIEPLSDNAYNIGNDLFRLASLYTNNIVQSGANLNIKTLTNADIYFNINNTDRWRVRAGEMRPVTSGAENLGSSSGPVGTLVTNYINLYNELKFIGNVSDIFTNTSDGSDTKRVRIGGGGDVIDTRGAFAEFYGNENTTGSGALNLRAGNSDLGAINLYTGSGNLRWSVTSGGHIQQNATGGGDIIFTKGSGVTGITGIDNTQRIGISPQTGISNSSVAILLEGTSSTGSGKLTLSCGTSSNILLRNNNTSGFVSITDSSEVQTLGVNYSGTLVTSAANEATGAGTALLGTNSPAVTNSAPFTWLRFKTSDGSTVYVPAWR